MGDKLVTAIMTALEEQTVTGPGHRHSGHRAAPPRGQPETVLQQSKQDAIEVEEILDTHPLARVLTSMPGIGVRTATHIPLEDSDATAFKTSAHLAAYAALVTRASGSSINGEHPTRTGNRKLKRTPDRVRRSVPPGQPHVLRPEEN